MFAVTSFAQTPLTFKDSQGRTVVFPQGEISFADKVVSVERGTSPATNKIALVADSTLGIPDYKTNTATYLSLGKNGSVTVEFTDNYLVDIEGPDLWIFEIGPMVESTKVAISKDGNTWIDVGTVRGGTSGIDIRSFVRPGDRFSFVRVTDNNNSSGEYGGADIDAIGAIGSIKREDPVPTPPKTDPKQPNTDGCCNMLRVEMKDGTVQMIDLSKVRSMTPVCNN